MRIAERLPVIADDHDERVLIEPKAADGVEQPSEMAVGLVQDVEIAIELVLIRHRFALHLEQRDARRRLVRMMRLRRPPHHEERADPAPRLMKSIIPSTMQRSSTPQDEIGTGHPSCW